MILLNDPFPTNNAEVEQTLPEHWTMLKAKKHCIFAIPMVTHNSERKPPWGFSTPCQLEALAAISVMVADMLGQGLELKEALKFLTAG